VRSPRVCARPIFCSSQSTDTAPSQLEACLRQIFTRFSSNGVVLTPTELDSWAIATNGTALSADEKEEMLEFLDMDDDGNLKYVSLVILQASGLSALSASRVSFKYISCRQRTTKTKRGVIL
jgi:hypothetical protein